MQPSLYPEPSSDKPIEVLPLWLIRHVCHAEGHKLIGKQKSTWFESRSYNDNWRPIKTWNPTTSSWDQSHLPTHYHGAASPRVGQTFYPARDIAQTAQIG